MVRPELNDAQLEAAANIIAGDVQPEAKTVDPADVQRARERVARAIAATGAQSPNEHQSRSLE